MTDKEKVLEKDADAKAHRGYLGWYVIALLGPKIIETGYHKRQEGAWSDAARRLEGEQNA